MAISLLSLRKLTELAWLWFDIIKVFLYRNYWLPSGKTWAFTFCLLSIWKFVWGISCKPGQNRLKMTLTWLLTLGNNVWINLSKLERDFFVFCFFKKVNEEEKLLENNITLKTLSPYQQFLEKMYVITTS